jgi:small subunit ribosomal protein S8
MYIDLIIKIKNAQKAGHKSLKTRYTKMDKAVAEVLMKRGFIKNVELKGKTYKKYLEIDLKGPRVVSGLKLVSRPSLHRYSGYQEMKKVKGGYGLLVVSTPKGILSGDEAKKQKVGGELLIEVW